MRQRLGIGRHSSISRVSSFLDEPGQLAGSRGPARCPGDNLQTARTATVFMSTHILNDVERVCDRVAILNFGHLVGRRPNRRTARPLRPSRSTSWSPEPGSPARSIGSAAAMTGQAWAREVRTTPDTVRVLSSATRRWPGRRSAAGRAAASTWSGTSARGRAWRTSSCVWSPTAARRSAAGRRAGLGSRWEGPA